MRKIATVFSCRENTYVFHFLTNLEFMLKLNQKLKNSKVLQFSLAEMVCVIKEIGAEPKRSEFEKLLHFMMSLQFFYIQ